VKALARAFRWRRMMQSGRFGTIDELAAAEKINLSYVSRLLRLTLLAPDIVEAILDGRQPEGITRPGLMEPFPVEWDRQPAGHVAWPSHIWGATTPPSDESLPPSKQAMMGLPRNGDRSASAGIGSTPADMASGFERVEVSQPYPIADQRVAPYPPSNCLTQADAWRDAAGQG